MRSVMYQDNYELPELLILDRTLESEDRVLEIGGGAGFVSTYAARKCGSDSVAVVEANPNLAPLIEENHRLNGVSPVVINAAVAPDSRETETFYLAEHFWSGSTARERPDRITVPAVDANSLIADYDPSYLIIDIEGAESEIVPTLDLRNVRKILIELHPQFTGLTAANEVILQLFEKGFVLNFDRSIRNQLYLVPGGQRDMLRASIGSGPAEAQDGQVRSAR